MMLHRFRQVDVFTRVPFAGNPVAVVFDGDSLDTAAMQTIARWTNLSETTFLCRATDPAADYRLRIFTPGSEMPFAGHPTLGSARAALDAGLVPRRPGRLVQQCGVGLVELRIDDDGALAFRVPPARITAIGADDRARIEEALGAAFTSAPQVVDVGPRWLTGELASAETVLALRPDLASLGRAYGRMKATGVNVFGRDDDGVVEVRSFAPNDGVPEDPVCGSGNAAVAAWRALHGTPGDYRARQGRAIGRDGHIRIRYEGEAIWIGGDAVACVEGTLRTAAPGAAEA